MENRFGYDFSQVQVHTGARAAESARQLDAVAYTAGRDIVFEEGKYRPRTASGQWLLAHELTHVVQQARHGTSQYSSPNEVQRSSKCKNQAAVDARVQENPRGYDLSKVTMYTHVIAQGDVISKLASNTKDDNNVTTSGDLSRELQELNAGLKTVSIGNCAILIRGWTSTAFTSRQRRINCDQRIEEFKKDDKLGIMSWETEQVQKSDTEYQPIVKRAAGRTPNLFEGRLPVYADLVRSLNEPWIGKLNEGECVALPVGWKDPNIGALPAKPVSTGAVTGDPAHVIATVYAEQSRTSANAKKQQKYIFFAIRKRIETAVRGPDIASVVKKVEKETDTTEFHALKPNNIETNYKPAIEDLKHPTPKLAGVRNAKEVVLDNWTSALPSDAGSFYFHWWPKSTPETCYGTPKKDAAGVQEKMCAWNWAKKKGWEGSVPKENGWLKMIRGDFSAPRERIGSMYIYP